MSKGTIVIIALFCLTILLLLGSYFLSFVLTENKISKSQEIASKTYYLAEAGIQKAIWKLKNDGTKEDGDDPWKICFASSSEECPDCNNWSDSFTLDTSPLIEKSQVSVSIKNIACGRGELKATSTIQLGNGMKSQRAIKTIVYKPLANPTEGASLFSGDPAGNTNILLSRIKVFGDFFVNNNLIIKFLSQLEVNATGTAKGKILVQRNYDVTGSNVTAFAKCAENICETTLTCECSNLEKFQKCEVSSCPPKKISLPMVDFDSESPNSFKSRALAMEAQGKCQNFCNGIPCSQKCFFEKGEFEDLLWSIGQGGILTLNTTSTPAITYVEGDIDLKGGRNLIVNGALVSQDNIKIGVYKNWKGDEGISQITINRPNATTTSGLLAKRKINFGPYSSLTTTTIAGVIYANEEITFVSLPKSFIVRGGIIGRKLDFNAVWEWFQIFLDEEIILYGLGYIIDGNPTVPIFSPIIAIEHWEEVY